MPGCCRGCGVCVRYRVKRVRTLQAVIGPQLQLWAEQQACAGCAQQKSLGGRNGTAQTEPDFTKSAVSAGIAAKAAGGQHRRTGCLISGSRFSFVDRRESNRDTLNSWTQHGLQLDAFVPRGCHKVDFIHCIRRSREHHGVLDSMSILKVVLFVFEAFILTDCARGPPRVSEKVTHRQSARIGSAIKLPCPVEGDPPPLIMWTKDGRNIHSGWIRFRILRMGLKIKEVEADDSGTYVCKATNGFGSVNINHTLIVIDDSASDKTEPAAADGPETERSADGLSEKLVRPRFTHPTKMRKRRIERPVGSSVRLKCMASGNPRPEIVWLKDDRLLTEQEVGEGRQKKWTLTLRNLTPEQSGKYTCRVSNQAGEINATYYIEVIQRTSSKPVLTGTHPVNTTVDYGGTTSFQCKVRSDVKPVIQWLKRVEYYEESRYNSTIEVGDHRFVVLPTGEVWSRPDGSYLNKLLITRAKEEDAGMYICLGANTMGYSFRSAFLTVLPDTKRPITPIFSPAYNPLPWPVIVGIPAGIVLIFGAVLLWFCQSRKHCPPPSAPAAAAQSLQSSHRPPYRERDRGCVAPASISSSPDKDCIASMNYEEYLAQQQLLLTHPALPPKVYPKIFTDIHTHTHSHVDGKVHQHQHIHFQC